MSNLAIKDIDFDDEVAFNMTDIQLLEGIGGIYFIFDGFGSLMYVGKTNNFGFRLKSYMGNSCHIGCDGIKNARIVKVVRIDNELARLEREKFYISTLIPPLNFTGTGGLSDRCIAKKISRPSRINVTITIDRDLHDKILKLSEKEKRSFSQQICKMAEDNLNKEKESQK